jgi:hypothetical protein
MQGYLLPPPPFTFPTLMVSSWDTASLVLLVLLFSQELQELESQDAKARKKKRKHAAIGPLQRTWMSVGQPLVQALFKVQPLTH